MCTADVGSGEGATEGERPTPPRRLRAGLAISASLLSGLRAYLYVSSTAKPRDFDQVWFAAHALLAGRNPYFEIGPGLRFDWPAPLYYPLTAAVAVLPLATIGRSI